MRGGRLGPWGGGGGLALPTTARTVQESLVQPNPEIQGQKLRQNSWFFILAPYLGALWPQVVRVARKEFWLFTFARCGRPSVSLLFAAFAGSPARYPPSCSMRGPVSGACPRAPQRSGRARVVPLVQSIRCANGPPGES